MLTTPIGLEEINCSICVTSTVQLLYLNLKSGVRTHRDRFRGLRGGQRQHLRMLLLDLDSREQQPHRPLHVRVLQGGRRREGGEAE